MKCEHCKSTMSEVDHHIEFDREGYPWRVVDYECACGFTDKQYIKGRVVEGAGKKQHIEFD